MKKLLIVLAAALALSVSAFADYDSFCSGSIDTLADGNSSFVLTSSDSSQPVYFWLEYSANQSQVYTNAISLVQNAPFTFTNSSSGSTSNLTCNTLYGTVDGQNFYVWRTSAGGAVSRYTHYPELSPYAGNAATSDVCSDLLDFINSTPDTPSVQSSFNVPCGNVVYFQVASEQDVTFRSYNQVLSSLLTFSSLGPWGDTGQRFGPAASLPSSGTSFPLLSQDPIHWNVDASSVNLLGQSRTAIKTVHCIANQWYAFYNPAYNSNNTDWTVNDITGATVGVFGSFAEVKVYPLEQVVDFSDGSFVGSSNDDYHSYYDGSIDSDGNVTFTDQDGNVSTPSAGGQNLLAPNESYQSLIDRVIGILDEIVHELKSLFTFGYEAVQDLVGIMRDFVNVLSGLYTWLPAEVYSALMSAVVVAIVIGVFKVFL